MNTIRIVHSPHYHDQNPHNEGAALPWEYSEEQFHQWVREVFLMDGTPDTAVLDTDEAIELIEMLGYEVEVV